MSLSPYYEQDGITIYHGDCREVMADFPDCFKVDATITDPPFGVGYGKYLSHDDALSDYGEIWSAISEAEARTSGYCVVFQAAKHCGRWHRWLSGREWRVFAAPLVKTTPIAEGNIILACDFALYWLTEEIEPWRNGGIASYRNWSVSHDAARVSGHRKKPAGHPCPRPLDTMTYIVNAFVPPGGVAIDPFAGAGTTLRAAKDLGRRAIGIEIEERYCEIAAKRLAQGVLPFSGAAT